MENVSTTRLGVAALILAMQFGSVSIASAQQASAPTAVTQAAVFPAEAPFLAENDAAMTKMMGDMAAAPTATSTATSWP